MLWRNSSILNDDESTTTIVNVRVQRKSEKLYEVNENRKELVKNKMVRIERKKGLCHCYRSFQSFCDIRHVISDQ